MGKRNLLIGAALPFLFAACTGGPINGATATPAPDKTAASEASEPEAALPNVPREEEISGEAVSVERHVLFTNPSPDPDMTLVEGLVDLIGNTAPGATIRISMYIARDIDKKPFDKILTALARAGRKAQMHLVLDDTNEGSPSARRRLAQIVRTSGGRFVLCEAGCVGTDSEAKNHNKFMLISELKDGTRDVIVQSSANWTKEDLIGKHQDTVVIMGDRNLYAAYEAYWLDLADAAGAGDAGDERYGWDAAGADGTRAYFFPRSAEQDPVTKAVAAVPCRPDGGTRIRIAMSKWTSPRSAIAEELEALRLRGCRIEILLSESSKNNDIRDLLADEGPIVPRCVAQLHSKYLLVEVAGLGEETPDYYSVWTGSHNYTGHALYDNDEVWLQLPDEALYKAFLANWYRMSTSAESC